MCIAQSATITRYCARLAKLTSMDEKENVVSDMLQEHCNDIFNEFGRAKYCPDVPELKEKWLEITEILIDLLSRMQLKTLELPLQKMPANIIMSS